MSTNKKTTIKAARFGFIGLTAAALAFAAFLSGCNKKESPAAVQNDSSLTTDVKVEAQKAADETKEMAKDAKDAVESAAKKTGAEVKEAAEKAGSAAKSAVDAAQ